MITTESNDVLEPVHDRMPAVLSDAQIPGFMGGELNQFGPSSVSLEFKEAANFLKAKGASKNAAPDQGELL